MAASESNQQALRKAAVLLLTLGEEASAGILRNLPPATVKKVGAEMAQIGTVSPEEVAAALEEFQRLVASSTGTRRGGIELTRTLLHSAFGQAEGEKLFLKLSTAAPANLAIPELVTLQQGDPNQLARILKAEHPQTIALLVAQFQPEYAACVFAALPEDIRKQVAFRVSRLEQVSAEVLSTVVTAISRQVAGLGETNRRRYHGVKTLADMINRLDPTLSEEVLRDLQDANETVANSVRDLLFIFEDLLMLDDAALRELVGRVDRKLLGVALKGTSNELQQYILSTMSQRGAAMFKEDMESMGPVRVKDVQEAQKQVIALVRQMETEGVISLRGKADSQYVV
jgi:flagellar motor switch protein FliG